MIVLPDLASDPRTLHVCKRPLAVPVRFAPADGVCRTLEGPVGYRRGDAILTGAHGEHWPIARDSFLESYEPVLPTRSGQDGSYRKRSAPVLALRLDHPFVVPVGWQSDPLHGKPGDWVLRYTDGSHGVVNDAIFRETYEPAAQETRWPPPE